MNTSKVILASILVLLSAVAVSDENEQRIEMVAESYHFTPDHIVVQAHRPVLLVIEKKGVVPHDFIIDDPASGLSIKESLGAKTEIRFTPEQTGTFEFYCGKKLLFFKSHRDKGMHGTLEVR